MKTPKTRALIADDEPLLAADLATRLARVWPELEIVAVVHNGVAALDALNRLQPAIAFLDIRMPGLTGLEVAQQARDIRWVFVTAFDQYAMDAFDRAAVDYLLKPVSDARLAQTVERLRGALSGPPPMADLAALLQQLSGTRQEYLRWIRAGVGQETHLIDVGEVVYFRADDKYTLVQTAMREYLIRTPLRELLTQLDPAQFWQVHRNTIVSVQQIASAHRELTGQVTLHLKQRPETLTVSRAFAHLFRAG
jgi:DNA-binding LytR/AlgR family response regulator